MKHLFKTDQIVAPLEGVTKSDVFTVDQIIKGQVKETGSIYMNVEILEGQAFRGKDDYQKGRIVCVKMEHFKFYSEEPVTYEIY